MNLNRKIEGKIRIKDIAERANVSAGTVDRVLHNRGEVNDGTRQRVMTIVEEMGYTPNILAKSLASRKTFRIAAIIPDASDNNPYWEKPLKGILQGAEEIRDYNTVVETFTFNAAEEASFKTVLNKVIESEPAGVVINPIFRESTQGFIQQMDEMQVPYVFVDIDYDQGNSLAYFGQDARRSGKVAAKIMSKILPEDSDILILKLGSRKVINAHLERREEGFIEFFKESKPRKGNLISVNADLLKQSEPSDTLKRLFKSNTNIKGIFVPSSRVFKVAGFLEETGLENVQLLGFDLIQQNIDYLESGIIDFLIGQKPEEQGYQSVMALFNHIVSRKEIDKTNYSPINIIINENIDYYK